MIALALLVRWVAKLLFGVDVNADRSREIEHFRASMALLHADEISPL